VLVDYRCVVNGDMSVCFGCGCELAVVGWVCVWVGVCVGSPWVATSQHSDLILLCWNLATADVCLFLVPYVCYCWLLGL